MQQSPFSFCRAWKKRGMSLFLALVLVLGLFPGVPGLEGEASAHWADPYLSQLVEWGFIRSDQAGYPDRALTRADFMAITNRAYGYHETGETPFEDVDEKDWFYDDVGIAYTARYIKGTSPTTASPKSTLTRETAATILGRNMMLQESAGELLDFADARQISSWAKGTVKSSLEHYLVSGYDDGTFRPQRNVSWGEMAAMVTNLIGTPLQEPGDYTLGGTFGNVTITSPGVTLRDTVISGDLYVTGGVGLGDVKLENVTVLGRIIASGAGSSEGGGASILLRNVIADELLVDNLQDNPVSVKADGITEIGHTTVRTTAFIEDNTPDGMGLHHISLEGESYPEGEEPEDWEPPVLTLAGRIEEVVNKTPNSIVHAASGTVAKLTVDEAAEGSAVVIDRNTVVKELNLDTTTTVTGEGDVGKLVVNAPGCVVEMLPDEIEIRPGITAEINGEEMDSVAAQESSEEPQILAGYPEARDIIPTGLDAVFMTNKAGTVYWAVSAITDGSVGEEDLIKPPSYGNIAVSNGSLNIAKGNEETIAKVGKLTPGGSYYLSAVLVDARDKRSTTKVISFTTPDNTTPAFCAGYPKMSKVSRTDSVVVVMPNKDCKLYYALLPEGATAPTENELKTSSVAGALGYGVRDVKKNVEDAFRVNDVILDETTNYVLYLWLVDADGVNKGKIVTLKFTTDDETPPEFIVDPTVNKVQATSVGLTFRLNENGTVYWVAVPAGTPYPKPEPGTPEETAPLNSDYAKMQVSSGMNIGPDGKAGKVTAKENADGTITVTGLKPETTYDFYYVAKDNAGPDRNFSEMVKKITISTADDKGPVFTQSFSRTIGTDKTKDPQSNTDIYLDVNENIQHLGQYGGKDFLSLYNDVKNATGAAKNIAKNLLALNLYNTIKLYKGNSETPVDDRHNCDDEFADYMAIDYTQATVEARKEGGIRITFPASGLHLENGAQYCFVIQDVYDLSNNQNEIEPNPVDFRDENSKKNAEANGHNVPPFDIGFSRIEMSEDQATVGSQDGPYERDASGGIKEEDDKFVRATMDKVFQVEPKSTSTVDEATGYDIILWCDMPSTDFDVYYRVVNRNTKVGKRIDDATTHQYPVEYTYTDPATNEEIKIKDYLIRSLNRTGPEQADENGWILLGTAKDMLPEENSWSGKSVGLVFNNCDAPSYPLLKNLSDQLRYEFVISLKTYKGEADRSSWPTAAVNFKVNIVAGQGNVLDQLANNLSVERFEEFTAPGSNLRDIGWSLDDSEHPLTLNWSQTAKGLPRFYNNTPIFSKIEHDSVIMDVSLSSPGTVYYVVDKAGKGGVNGIRTPLPEEVDILNKNPDLWEKVGELMMITWNPPEGIDPPPNSGKEPIPNWMKGPKVPGTIPGDDDVDEPGNLNTIQQPSPGAVARPKELWIGSAPADQGSVHCGPSKPEQVELKNLEPDTDYFIYAVIDNEAQKTSHVYMYHFKTEKTPKPKINIRPYTNGTVDLWTPDVDSTMAYVLFEETNAWKIPILKDDFSKYIDTSGEFVPTGKTIPDCWGDKWTAPEGDSGGKDRKFTVLDALRTTYSNSATENAGNKADAFVPLGQDGTADLYEGGYSVFDIYANRDIRQKIDALIRNFDGREPAEVIRSGQDRLYSPKKDDEKNLEFDPPIDSGEYVILVAGQRQVMGSDDPKIDYLRDAFKANIEVYKSDSNAPDLESVEMCSVVRNKKPNSDEYDTTYTLSAMLKFDKPLYNKDEDPLTKDEFLTALLATPDNSIKPELTWPSTGAAASGFTLFCDEMQATSGFVVLNDKGSEVIWNKDHIPADETLSIGLSKQRFETEETEKESIRNEYLTLTIKWGNKALVEQEFLVSTVSTPKPQTPDTTNPGGNGGTTTSLDPVKPTGLKLASTSGAKLVSGYGTSATYSLKLNGTNGMSSTVTAEVTPSNATDRVYWTSSNSSVAAVSGANRTAVITGKAAGSATITVTVGSLTKTILITVEPSLSVTSFKPDSSKDTIAKASDGSWTWTRPAGSGRREAELTFSTGLSMKNAKLSVESSDPKAVKPGSLTLSQDGKTATVQMSFLAMNAGKQATITITVGTVVQKFTVKLVGSDVAGVNLAVKTK